MQGRDQGARTIPQPRLDITKRGSRRLVAAGLALLATVSLAGCDELGALGYFMGVGRNEKIEAEFELPDSTLLILVDDPSEKVRWPRARTLLAKYIGDELLDHDAVPTIVRPEALARLRSLDVAFENYPAAAIGRKLEADTVLFIEVRDFFAPLEIEDTGTAAKLTVSVKVLDANENKRAHKVRLWPTDSGGHIVEAQLKGVEVHQLDGEKAVAQELARKAAIRVARLFHRHTFGDLDDES